jgi:hypothetical protein
MSVEPRVKFDKSEKPEYNKNAVDEEICTEED